MAENEQNKMQAEPQDTDNSYIIVEATTANGIIPVPEAHVMITKDTNEGTVLYGTLETGPNGKTPTFVLPAPEKSLSEDPGNMTPAYDIYFARVSHPGYYMEDDHIIQVFGGATSYLNVDLIPLPEHYREGVIVE